MSVNQEDRPLILLTQNPDTMHWSYAAWFDEFHRVKFPDGTEYSSEEAPLPTDEFPRVDSEEDLDDDEIIDLSREV